MASKRTTSRKAPEDAAAPMAATPPSGTTPPGEERKFADLSVRELLQMLGRVAPEAAPSAPTALSILPANVAAGTRVAELTLADLLELLKPFR